MRKEGQTLTSVLICLLLISMTSLSMLSRREQTNLCLTRSVPPDCNADGTSQIQMRVLPRLLPNGWELETTITNRGRNSVLIMTEPVRVDGSKGPYIMLNKMAQGSLDVQVQLYRLPIYSIYTNRTLVRLERLGPGQNRTEKLEITFPTEETMPPYGETPERNPVLRDQIKVLNVSLGILPDEEGIRDILQRKSVGPWVDGLEELMTGAHRGKRLIELQTVVCSGSIRL
jgi:hypothetical protein